MQNPFYKAVTDGRVLPAGGNYCGESGEFYCRIDINEVFRTISSFFRKNCAFLPHFNANIESFVLIWTIECKYLKR